MILWLLPVLLLLYMRFEASWLEVTHHVAGHVAGMRVAVLSDLHIPHCRVSARRVRQVLDMEHPDILLFLGDAIDRPAHIARAAAWLGTCAEKTPAFAVLGNHDHQLFDKKPEQLEKYRNVLSKNGIRLCINETFLYKEGTHRLLLTALDDARHGEPRLPEIPQASNAPAPFHLLMTHNPQRLVSLPDGHADFAVAGHFHGGQIWMPFGLEFRLFRKEPLGRKGIRRGLHTIRGTPAWLTRGIGNVLFPLRLGARPEVTILDL